MTEKSIENTETTAEQTKTFTQEEVDAIVKTRVQEDIDKILPSKLERQKAKIERDMRKRYEESESLLIAGTGAENIEDAKLKMNDLLQKKGITVAHKSEDFNDRELQILANADAMDVISDGYGEIVAETDRLSQIQNMSARDKLYYQRLMSERNSIEQKKELSSAGITENELNSDDFKEFASMLNKDMSVKDKYNAYLKYRPKKDIENPGSLVNNSSKEIKDFYTQEEVSKFTQKELMDNPDLLDRVTKSMTKW